MKTIDAKKISGLLIKNKYFLIVLILGLVLLLLPKRTGERATTEGLALESTGVSLHEESQRLAEVLSNIRGVGRTQAMLSGSGAVIICEGADSATVRLSVTRAVSAFTGLDSDDIVILKLK